MRSPERSKTELPVDELEERLDGNYKRSAFYKEYGEKFAFPRLGMIFFSYIYNPHAALVGSGRAEIEQNLFF